jgi:hypothetical protein
MMESATYKDWIILLLLIFATMFFEIHTNAMCVYVNVLRFFSSDVKTLTTKFHQNIAIVWTWLNVPSYLKSVLKSVVRICSLLTKNYLCKFYWGERVLFVTRPNATEIGPGLPDGFIENQKWKIWSFQSVSGFEIFGWVFGLSGFIWFSYQQ